MSVTQITAWVRGNMGTTVKWAIGALTVAFALGGYVVKAQADNAVQDRRLDAIEAANQRRDRLLEIGAYNGWANCIANREKLEALGITCRGEWGR